MSINVTSIAKRIKRFASGKAPVSQELLEDMEDLQVLLSTDSNEFKDNFILIDSVRCLMRDDLTKDYEEVISSFTKRKATKISTSLGHYI